MDPNSIDPFSVDQSSSPQEVELPAAEPQIEEKDATTRPFPPLPSKKRGAGRSRTVFVLRGEQLIAVQLATGNDTITVQRSGVAPVPSTNARTHGPDLVAAIDTAIQSFPDKPKQVELILPEDSIKKTIVSLPAIQPKKAWKVLRNRALQVSGLPDEELLWAARPLGTYTADDREVANWMVFTLSRPALAGFCDVFKEAGVRLCGAFPPTSMLTNLSSSTLPSDTPSEGVFGEVILADEMAIFNVIGDSTNLFSRSIRFEGTESDEDRRDILAGELQRSFMYCQQNVTESTPESVEVLFAGSPPPPGLIDAIESQTRVTTVPVDLGAWIKVSDSIQPGELPESVLPMLVGAGLIPPSGRERTDLLPKDMKPRNWSLSAKITTTLAIVEIGLLIFRLSGHLDETLARKRAILSDHKASQRALGPTLDALQTVQKRDQFLQELEKQSAELVPVRYDWIPLFRDLSAVPDGDIHFSRLEIELVKSSSYVSGKGEQPSEEWRILLDVGSPQPYRQAQQTVQSLVQNLRQSKFLRTVNMRPSSSKKKDSDHSKFTIECELHK